MSFLRNLLGGNDAQVTAPARTSTQTGDSRGSSKQKSEIQDRLNDPIQFGKRLQKALTRIKLQPQAAATIDSDSQGFADSVAKALGYTGLHEQLLATSNPLDNTLATLAIEPFQNEEVIRYMVSIVEASLIRHRKFQEKIGTFTEKISTYNLSTYQYGPPDRQDGSVDYSELIADFLLEIRGNAERNVALKWESVPIKEFRGKIPGRVLGTAMQIQEAIPAAQFSIHFTSAARPFQLTGWIQNSVDRIVWGSLQTALFDVPTALLETTSFVSPNFAAYSTDPFLEVAYGGVRRFVDVWDELEFQKAIK
mgnify:CR=1 FL=1